VNGRQPALEAGHANLVAQSVQHQRPEAPIFVPTFDLLARPHATHAGLLGLGWRVHKPTRRSVAHAASASAIRREEASARAVIILRSATVSTRRL
jgi:hypothetical protein